MAKQDGKPKKRQCEGRECLKRLAIFLLLFLGYGYEKARADSSFFEDKTIRLVLGFSPVALAISGRGRSGAP